MSRKLLLSLIYGYALLFSVLKTIRLPNDWSEGHWLLDYRFGFIKRGLAGEVFGFFFDKSEFSILMLSSVILFVLFTILLVIAVRKTNVLKQGLTYDHLFYVLFFLSEYIIFSAHLIGYFDHVIFLMTFLSIFLIKKKQIFLSSVLMSCAILVHEMSFFLMLPISIFTIFVTEINVQEFTFKKLIVKQIIKKLALYLLLPLVTMLSISYYQEINGYGYYSKLSHYLRQFDFITDKRADEISSGFTEKFTIYFKEQSVHFGQRIFVSRCSILYGIPILFMMFLIYKKFQKVHFNLLIILAACILAPLLLHAIALDTYRIWTFPFMILFFGYGLLNSEDNKQISRDNIPKWIVVLFVFCVFLVTMIPNPLFDDEVERFTTVERLLFLVPLVGLMIGYVKSPKKNIEA